jgi:glycosyltransferase involved in cell wall biosynthesis
VDAATRLAAVSLRICLVTPFSWSQPHDVNEHVAGAAAGLRRLGHEVTILAPSSRRRDLLAGRRALAAGQQPELIAVGPAVPVSRRSQLGVGSRANLRLALQQGAYDIVHGFEPGLPSLSSLALAEARALTLATFLSSDRLAFPATRAHRDRLRIRVDALLATSSETVAAAVERFPGEYRIVPLGVDLECFRPGRKRRLIAVHTAPASRPLARAAIRALDELPGWELSLVHTTPLAVRPSIPLRLRARVHARTGRRANLRATVLDEAAIFVSAVANGERQRLEAAAAGCAIVDVPADSHPDDLTREIVRLAVDDAARGAAAESAAARAREQSFDRLAGELDAVYRSLTRKRRPSVAGNPLAGRDWILVDLHMHTAWSHDCSIDVGELLHYAARIGLGGVAITDHNTFGGALEAVELAREHGLVVIPGEEIKTDHQGEVIGLFLEREIPRGMSFADTIAAIREQGGLVYLPHPFDRLHAIPDPATLHRHLEDIDVLEVYNARLLRESFNDEALRFARKYRLLQGAGSDAHVLQGVGTGALRMRLFDGPEEFLLSLRSADVLRRPKSLAYLQSLKWVAQMRDKVQPLDRRSVG